jgi:hypothetical protein
MSIKKSISDFANDFRDAENRMDVVKNSLLPGDPESMNDFTKAMQEMQLHLWKEGVSMTQKSVTKKMIDEIR